MQLCRLHIEYSFYAVGRFATSHFSDESKRIAFVKQTQFPFRFIGGAGIHKNTAFDQVAVHIGHHTTYITLSIGSAVILILFLTSLNIILNAGLIAKKIAVIHGIYLAKLGAYDIGVT